MGLFNRTQEPTKDSVPVVPTAILHPRDVLAVKSADCSLAQKRFCSEIAVSRNSIFSTVDRHRLSAIGDILYELRMKIYSANVDQLDDILRWTTRRDELHAQMSEIIRRTVEHHQNPASW